MELVCQTRILFLVIELKDLIKDTLERVPTANVGLSRILGLTNKSPTRDGDEPAKHKGYIRQTMINYILKTSGFNLDRMIRDINHDDFIFIKAQSNHCNMLLYLITMELCQLINLYEHYTKYQSEIGRLAGLEELFRDTDDKNFFLYNILNHAEYIGYIKSKKQSGMRFYKFVTIDKIWVEMGDNIARNYTDISCLTNMLDKKCSMGEMIIKSFLNRLYYKRDKIYTFLHDKPKFGLKGKKNRDLRYDFILSVLKIIIEVDGIQHSKHIKFFHKNIEDFLYLKDTDKLKDDTAISNGYIVFRINDWELNKKKLQELQDIIDKRIIEFGLNVDD